MVSWGQHAGADNSAWQWIGTYYMQPSNGVVVIRLPSALDTWGILMQPLSLGTDDYGNHYFQLSDISFGIE